MDDALVRDLLAMLPQLGKLGHRMVLGVTAGAHSLMKVLALREFSEADRHALNIVDEVAYDTRMALKMLEALSSAIRSAENAGRIAEPDEGSEG